MPALSFDHLDPTQFEEFCFDLMTDMGYVNVDWRKGTGKSGSPADQGRDIVADEQRSSPDGRMWLDRWFVDCKHYKSGVPPDELLNLMTWAMAERPAVVCVCASNYLSNGAKTWLATYEGTKPPFRIVTWELPQLSALAEGRSDLLAKYELDMTRRPSAIKDAELFGGRTLPRTSSAECCKSVWPNARLVFPGSVLAGSVGCEAGGWPM